MESLDLNIIITINNAQVQGQLGVTQCKWCDFIVYTSKGMSIEEIPYDHAY